MNDRLHLTPATVFTAMRAAAVLATALLLQAQPAHAAPEAAAVQPVPMRVVQLPRIVVVGKRLQPAQAAPMQVVQLPRVEVFGRRLDAGATRVVQAPAAKSPAVKPA